MSLWTKITGILKDNLAANGALAFSYAGPHVARLLINGERDPNAEVAEKDFSNLIDDCIKSGFGYARHDGAGGGEWRNSIISHSRLFEFLHDEGLSILSLGEQLYD